MLPPADESRQPAPAGARSCLLPRSDRSPPARFLWPLCPPVPLPVDPQHDLRDAPRRKFGTPSTILPAHNNQGARQRSSRGRLFDDPAPMFDTVPFRNLCARAARCTAFEGASGPSGRDIGFRRLNVPAPASTSILRFSYCPSLAAMITAPALCLFAV